jgi:SAM-dependent methyltransferase
MNYPERGYFSRSRGLGNFNKLFGTDKIQSAIGERIKAVRDRPTRVLEIGCGEGRALLELRKQFPDIELHGWNKEPWPAMLGKASLPAVAIYHNIFSEDELRNISLPEIHFGNAEELTHADKYFDVIISQVSIHYIARKDFLLQEAWRALAPGGLAFLQVDTNHKEGPDFMRGDCPRFVIYDSGNRILFESLVEEQIVNGFNIRVQYHQDKSSSPVIVLMEKNCDQALALDLHYDGLSSIDLMKINRPETAPFFWGFRSVFIKNGPVR